MATAEICFWECDAAGDLFWRSNKFALRASVECFDSTDETTKVGACALATGTTRPSLEHRSETTGMNFKNVGIARDIQLLTTIVALTKVPLGGVISKFKRADSTQAVSI